MDRSTSRNDTAKDATAPSRQPFKPSSRQSTLTDRLSKPTAASTTRTTPSLSKPPARPTLAPSARKPATTSTTISTTATASHRGTASVTSVDDKTSDDESKRDGITAKPKRMSVVPSTTDRTTISSTRTAPAPLRRTSTATSTATVRRGAASPVTSRTSLRSPTTTRLGATSKTAPTNSTVRSRTTATTPRTGPALTDRKRLSTIQASPATRLAGKQLEDTATDSDASPRSRRLRPALGSRKSTNSVLMEQRIREFELVSQMLQQAMASEGTDPEEQAALDAEAAETMSRLRTTLAKVRKFEKQHGRMPSEAELTEVSSVDEDAMTENGRCDLGESTASATPSVMGEHGHTLREELNESRAYASQLEHQVHELNTQLRDMADHTPAEGEPAGEATELAMTEHNAKMREMSSANQARLDHLRTIHWEEMKEVREQHQQELEHLKEQHDRETTNVRTSHESDLADKEDQLQRMQEEIAGLASKTEETSKSRENDAKIKNRELETLRKQIEELNTQTAAALAAKNKYADGLQDQLDALHSELDQVRNIKPDTSESDAKLADLLRQLEVEKAKALQADQGAAEIAQLKIKLEQAERHLEQQADLELRVRQLTDDLDAEKRKSGASDKDTEIARLRAEVEVMAIRLDPETSVSPSRDVSPVKADAEKEKLRDKLAAMERRHQAAKENAKSKSAKQAEEHASKLAEASHAHKLQLDASQSELTKLQQSLEEKEVELVSLQKGHTAELVSLRKELTDHANELNVSRESIRKFEHQAVDFAETRNTLASLRTSFESLQSEKQDLEAQMEAALAEAKGQQAEQLTTVAGQLSEAQQELQQLKDSHQLSESAEVTRLTNDLARAKLEIAKLQRNHEHSAKSLEEQLRDSEQSNKDLQAQYDTTLIELQEATKAGQSFDQVKSDLESQVASLTSQVADLHSAADHMVTTHSDELAKLTKELNRIHAQEITTLKHTHSHRLKQLEDEATEAMLALEDLEKASNERLADVQSTAEADKVAALRLRDDAHEVALADRQKRHDRQLADQLEQLRTKHNSALHEVESKLVKSRDSALTALQEEHKSALAERDAQPRGMSDDEVAALRQGHVEQVSKLESANHELSSQVEGTSFQLQTLKGILADQERQNEENEKQHAKELQAERDQFSQAVIKISQHGAQLAAKDAEHATALEGMRQEIEEAHQGVLVSLQADHAAALDDLKDRMIKADEATRDGLVAEHEQALAALRQAASAQELDVDKLRSDHAAALQSVEENLALSHKAVIDSLTMEHTTKLDSLTNELEERHKAALTKAAVEHEAALADERAVLQTSMDSLSDDHKRAVDALQDELDESRGKIRHQEQAQKEFAAAVLAHDQEMARINEKHAVEMARIQEQLSNTKLAQETVKHQAVVHLEHQLEQAKAELEKVNKEYARVRSESETKHSQELRAMQKELDDVRGRLAESARRSDTIAQPATTSSVHSTTASPTGSSRSASGGLGASRWAEGSPSGLDAKAKEFSPHGVSRETSHNGKKKTERNVHGQLAGINEDIKSLSSLGEMMLEANRRLARTLNRIDEHTGEVDASINGDRVTTEEE